MTIAADIRAVVDRLPATMAVESNTLSHTARILDRQAEHLGELARLAETAGSQFFADALTAIANQISRP